MSNLGAIVENGPFSPVKRVVLLKLDGVEAHLVGAYIAVCWQVAEVKDVVSSTEVIDGVRCTVTKTISRWNRIQNNVNYKKEPFIRAIYVSEERQDGPVALVDSPLSGGHHPDFVEKIIK